jgi:hypothetical protein
MRNRVIAGAVAGLAVAGGGAAVAATQFRSPQHESQAVVADAAKQLGVQPSALSAALKKALEGRVDAAVADGRLTKAQGDDLKQRIESGELPIFGPLGPYDGDHPPGPIPFANLDAAASYLGLSDSELITQLRSGKSLGDVAKAQGKTASGLVGALLDAAKKRLDRAVAAGRLTQAQEDEILPDLKSRLTDVVNGVHPWFDRDHRGFDRPPLAPFAGPRL